MSGMLEKRRIGAAALAAAVILAPAEAPAWALYGKGSDSCAKFTTVMHGMPFGTGPTRSTPDGVWYGESVAYAQWVQGYISALNSLNSQTPRQIVTDWATTDEWLRSWCNAHPIATLEQALGTYIVSHLPGVELRQR